jgi:hypothetical protein
VCIVPYSSTMCNIYWLTQSQILTSCGYVPRFRVGSQEVH